MEKYNVHVFPVVRVKIEGVEAESMVAAIDAAVLNTNWYNFFESQVPEAEWAEEISHYLVDVEGDTEYVRSKFFNAHVEPMTGSRRLHLTLRCSNQNCTMGDRTCDLGHSDWIPSDTCVGCGMKIKLSQWKETD